MISKGHIIFILIGAVLFSSCGTAQKPTKNAVDTQATAMAMAFTMVAETQAAIPTATSIPPTPTSFSPTFTLAPPTNTQIPTMTFTPAATLPASADCVPLTTQRQEGLVVGIVDGDTIDVNINNQIYRVRYIGVDTPESGDPLFFPATAANQNLVYSKNVLLVKDVSETDRYDRLLRYVFVGDVFVNHELVKQGYAVSSTYPPDVACADYFASAQNQAQSAKVGLWAPTATPFVLSGGDSGSGGGTSGGSTGNCHPAYPGVCIPPPPPDLDCKDVSYRRFQVLPPDPHGFDGDNDGIGCES